jgi:hypothetical protein
VSTESHTGRAGRPGETQRRAFLRFGLAPGLRRAPHRSRRPHPDDYDETVQRNVREQDTDARPAIANRLASIGLRDGVSPGP